MGTPHGHDLGFEEADYWDTIRMEARDARETAYAARMRARDTRERAQQAVADARALAYMCMLGADAFVGRCAWCGRYRIDGEWLPVSRTRFMQRRRVTHSICEDCTTGLREDGQSL